MDFQLIDSKWGNVFDEAVEFSEPELLIVCPFIKQSSIHRLLANKPRKIRVITRFNPADFIEGVSDLTALSLLLEQKAEVRGVKGLHAKLYLFGQRRVIVTSANLTGAALTRNHEFGFVSGEPSILKGCREYFDKLWDRAGASLTESQLARWEATLTDVWVKGAPPSSANSFLDEGADAGVEDPVFTLNPVDLPPQFYVKFFGKSDRRQSRARPILEQVEESGAHWAATYPADKRPRSVVDGAVIFIAHLVKEPDDILIFGKAVAMAYREGRDDATPSDLDKRPWKAD